MALTANQRNRMHRALNRLAGDHDHNYSKPQMREAFDAFEAERVSRDTALKSDVNTATTNKTWSVGRFKRLYQAYMQIMAEDGW